MFFNGFILLHFNSVHNFVIACTMCSSLLPSILSACLCDQCIDLELISHSFGFSFSENIITDLGFVDIFPASRIPKHMQHLLKPIYRTMSGASKEPLGSRDMVKEKGFCVTTDPGTLSSILKWASDAEQYDAGPFDHPMGDHKWSHCWSIEVHGHPQLSNRKSGPLQKPKSS
ncbi:uncharacterized protein LOC131238677 isoform X2 [Magnolia sinica]|uniref:uncharacterized protein LOC131238677 isoform X2 n=1 Tax=Magnolia sinica TaxID=86752 RepID=UPI00265A7EA6|nr:uncharacterized protein LOC131238677 isoform X2 [Magnolia sinica]